ncbi:MAG: hypothetical protein IKR17_00990, partial [Bacteroidales bacterium]|nr:hypothetical protein [Bacteroidales bacterium]
QQPQQQPMQGLGSLETLMGIAFGGLAGTQEGSAVNAMFGVRDQLVRNEFERKADLMRQDYERKQTEREINELKESRDNYRKRVEELERQNEAMSREIRDKNDELEDAESRIEELERMKPEASIAGVALTGVGAKIAETLLLRHAGTVGKLFGVEKEAMLGMLTDDLNEQPETPQQAAPTASAPVVVSEATDGTDEEQDSRISSLKVLFNSLSETEQNDFWSVVLFIDEHRDKLHQMAMSIEGQRKKEQEAA